MDFQAVAQAIFQTLKNLAMNNWSFFLGGLIAVLSYRFLRASAKIVVSIVVASIIVSLLTNLGVLPPLDTMLSTLKGFISGIIHDHSPIAFTIT